MSRLIPLVLLAACATPGEGQLWLIDTLTLEGQPKPGMASGFDLDGVVSPEGDPQSCGHGDLLGIDGTQGVDNAFSALLPAMELVAGEAVHSLVQAAIDEGNLLVTLNVSAPQGESVALEVARALGPALRGADGRLVAGQTLTYAHDLPSSSVDDAQVHGRRTLAKGLELDLPLAVLGYELEFTLEQAYVEMIVDHDEAHGRLSGFLSLDQLEPTLDFINSNGDPQIAEPIRAALEANADLDRDGNGDCRYLSMNVEYTAVPAWFYTEDL